MEDGYYNMTAMIMKSNGFSNLEMYAESNGKLNRVRVVNENTSWKLVEIKKIMVRNGKVEIGFVAEGAANHFCYVDDVLLVRTK